MCSDAIAAAGSVNRWHAVSMHIITSAMLILRAVLCALRGSALICTLLTDTQTDCALNCARAIVAVLICTRRERDALREENIETKHTVWRLKRVIYVYFSDDRREEFGIGFDENAVYKLIPIVGGCVKHMLHTKMVMRYIVAKTDRLA